MSDNDWTDRLREQLADYQVPVGDDMWTGISQSLEPTQQPSHRRLSWRRWTVAASLALLTIGGAWYLLHSDEADNTNQTARKELAKTKNSTIIATPQSSAPLLASAVMEHDDICNNVRKQTAPAVAFEEERLGTRAEELVERDLVVDSSEPTVSEEPKTGGMSSFAVPVYDTPVVRRRKTMGLQVKVYGENGVMTSPSATGQGAGDLICSSFVMSNGVVMSDADCDVPVLRSEQVVEEKHHHPVAVGMQVGIGILPRLTLTTGVVYTRAVSDLMINGIDGSSAHHQVLRYVGIPLGVSYEVWSTKQLHIYVNAGGECDFNVLNRTEADGYRIDVSKDREQWSGNVSVGVQYDVVPQVGIYVEPGMKYYFDNGSNIRNTFKDKKLNFNFQFGLRVNLSTK